MKRILTCLLFAAILLLPSCATIFTRSSYPFKLNTEPAGANVIITNSAGIIVYQGTTPTETRLKTSRGYMKDETYTIAFSKEGYADRLITVSSSFDGWYLGNILLGGLIGMLIVDPISGAMYRFKRSERNLTEQLVATDRTAALMIYDINHLLLVYSTPPENLLRLIFGLLRAGFRD